MAAVAIPLIALGSMWVISNQNKDKEDNDNENKIEHFTNQKLTKENLHNTNNLSHSNFHNENYKLKDINDYPNNNQFTDKYYSDDVYKMVENNSTNDIIGLTGEKIDVNNFKHNNMVPYFGAKIKGSSNDGLVDSRLDSMQGAGSLLVDKNEHGPLFQPHNNLQHTNGCPNFSDFMQSRMNPSQKIDNVVPWKKEQVAPGLDKGYTTTGGIGFNTSLEARDKWQPKTVDELRVDTNPKRTYSLEGHQGPLNHQIKYNSTEKHQGKVEKYGPDTHYTVGPQRWFTTTGQEKAQSIRSVELLQEQNRIDTTREYYGSKNIDNATYVKGEFQQSRRPVLAAVQNSSNYAPNSQGARDGDYGLNSFKALPNARSTSEQPDNVGAAHGVVRSVMAPLLDIFRPTRKENVLGNIRESGNVQNKVNALPVYNPADRTKTTIRETIKEKNHLNIENQDNKGYLVNPHQPISNNRMNTSSNYIGNANNGNAPTTYNAAYKQRNNVNKNTMERINSGCNQRFSQKDNISIARRDQDRVNNRMWAPQSTTHIIPSSETHGKMSAPQYYNEQINNDRINPELLNAFKNNPYTKSLNSY